jgi:hypothetical protein
MADALVALSSIDVSPVQSFVANSIARNFVDFRSPPRFLLRFLFSFKNAIVSFTTSMAAASTENFERALSSSAAVCSA